MMSKAPGESKAAKAARLAEEARVEQERVRAENNRIDETQNYLSLDTLRRSRRFGKLGSGSLASFATGGFTPTSTSAPGLINVSAAVAQSLASGGSAGGGSRRSGSLVNLV